MKPSLMKKHFNSVVTSIFLIFGASSAFGFNIVSVGGKTYTCDGPIKVVDDVAVCNGSQIEENEISECSVEADENCDLNYVKSNSEGKNFSKSEKIAISERKVSFALSQRGFQFKETKGFRLSSLPIT